MNYYRRHLGDYAKDTGHLTVHEHGVYNLLLDRYYGAERPISTAEAFKVCRARSPHERETVETVLSEFFQGQDGNWSHKRADLEIAAYNVKSARNRDIGKKGGRPRTQTVSENNPDGFHNETQTVSSSEPKVNPSHKPLANSQEKDKNSPDGEPPAVRGKKMTFTAWTKSLPDGAQAIPADHAVFAYAERVGIPADFLALAWAWFDRRYSSESKTYTAPGWPTVFRKSVEGNWGKLWWIEPDGSYRLTTVGVQLERAMRSEAAA